MINSDPQNINKYIKNLNLNNNTGDVDIDKIINNYNSNYILRVINKINNKILKGGTDALFVQLDPLNNDTSDVLSKTSDMSTTTKIPNYIPVGPNELDEFFVKREKPISAKDLQELIKILEKKSNILKEKEANLKKKEANLKEKEANLKEKEALVEGLKTDNNKIALNIPPTNTDTETESLLKKIFG